MSAAGALALASVAPPPTAGAASPAGAPSDARARSFDGLLASEGEAVPLESDPSTRADSAPAEAAKPATPAADVVPPVATAAIAPPAAPPPMDDPATRSVLNALALRVATEAQDVATAPPSGAAALAGRVSTATLALSSLVPPGPANPASPTGAMAPAADAAPMAVATAAAVATAFGAPPSILRAGSSTATGASAVTGQPQADAAEGDRAGALDALVSSLESLLPSAHPKAMPAPVAPAAATAAASPSQAPLAAAVPPTAVTTAPAQADAAAAVLDAAASDPGADAAGSPNGTAGAGPTGGSPAPFAVHLASAPGATPAPVRADGGQPPITVPFDSPQWGNELATRVVSLAKEQFTEAEIRVTPDELGPIEVKLRFDGDRVHAQFGAISPEAREALTSNLHRLREMLAGEGLNLGQAFVGHHGQDAARRFDGQAARTGGGGGDGDEDAPLGEVRGTTTVRRGLLDEFA